ncbi:MAG: GNAT family N-acetyltransferase [Betaproteobacteria bacterium]
MNFTIRAVTEGDSAAASAVVQASFTQLAAADWEPAAQQWFIAASSPEAMAEKLKVAACARAAFVGERMVGFLLMPSPTVLAMLFVDPQWLRQGIARELWQSARSYIEATYPDAQTVELNATPYAVDFYLSVGFVPLSREFTRDGCRITRMACWLPVNALGAQCAPAPRLDPTSSTATEREH